MKPFRQVVYGYLFESGLSGIAEPAAEKHFLRSGRLNHLPAKGRYGNVANLFISEVSTADDIQLVGLRPLPDPGFLYFPDPPVEIRCLRKTVVIPEGKLVLRTIKGKIFSIGQMTFIVMASFVILIRSAFQTLVIIPEAVLFSVTFAPAFV